MTAATGLLLLNGVDAETIGFSPVGFGGLLGASARAVGLLPIPGLPGAIDPGVAPSESARRLTFTGRVEGASASALLTTLDAIKEVCGTGLVEIRTGYSTSRAHYGVLEPFDADPIVPKYLSGLGTFTVSFICPSPYAIDLASKDITLRSTPVAIPLGDAPSLGRDEWSAIIELVPGSAVTLTYLNARDETISTMAFTGLGLGTGEPLIIDCGRQLCKRFIAGVKSDAMTYLTAGYAFPALDPSDGYIAGSLYPKLKCSAGTGVIRYFRHWK